MRLANIANTSPPWRAHGLDDALRRYARKFAWRLGLYHLQIADFSTGRKMRRLERRAFRKAPTDPVVARAFGGVLTREHSPLRLLDPRFAARLVIPRRPAARRGVSARPSKVDYRFEQQPRIKEPV